MNKFKIINIVIVFFYLVFVIKKKYYYYNINKNNFYYIDFDICYRYVMKMYFIYLIVLLNYF